MGARRCTAQVFFHSRLPRVAPFWSDCVAIGRRDVKGWVGEDRLDMSSSSFMKTLKKEGTTRVQGSSRVFPWEM